VSSPFHPNMQNALVRMVVPMRREFGCALDVHQMRHDRAYAKSIIAQALTSRVQSLRDHARLVGAHLGDAEASLAAQQPDTERATPLPDPTLAARRLIDLVGPMGEPLAIRIERAPNAQDLEKLIGDARALIVGVRGEQAAAAFMQQTVHSSAMPDAASHGGNAALRRSARVAACELLALIGPLGEELAARIEDATDTRALKALIDEAHQGITAVVGTPAADEFLHRVT
jgi:hypothetical protein